MNPEALLQLIEDFDAFREAGNILYQRIEEFSTAVARTEPLGEAEKVLLDHLKTLLDSTASRLGRVHGTTSNGGAAWNIFLASGDLRKTPEFASAFAHIRRSKNLPDDFGEGRENGAAYSAPLPKALSE